MKKTKITIAGTVIEVPFGTEVLVEIGSQTYNFDNQGKTLVVKSWTTDEDNGAFEVVQFQRK